MTLTTVIDVAIGMIFVFLLVGLFVTALQESLAALLKTRGRLLRSALKNLLSGAPAGATEPTLFADVFSHSLVAGLSDKQLPSYVPAANFSLALIEALRSGDGSLPLFSQIEAGIAELPEGAAKQSLRAFVTEAAGDVQAFKARLETWYADAMDRISGVYKRYSHTFALVCGLVIAVAFNVDSITIAKTLWYEPESRAIFVTQAQQFAEENKGADGLPHLTAKQANDYLEELPVPIGWTDPGEFCSAIKKIWPIFGWLITALAASLGAPFWFDTLQRFLKIRAAGPKPEKPDGS